MSAGGRQAGGNGPAQMRRRTQTRGRVPGSRLVGWDVVAALRRGRCLVYPAGKASGEEGVQTPLLRYCWWRAGAGRVQKEEMAAGGGAVYPGV